MPRLSEILDRAERYLEGFFLRLFPGVRDVVEAYLAVMRVQARWEDRLWDHIHVSREEFLDAVRRGKTLVEAKGVPLPSVSGELMLDILRAVSRVDPMGHVDVLVRDARRLLELASENKFNPQGLVEEALTRSDAVEEAARRLGVEPSSLNAFILWTLQPSLHVYALKASDGRLEEHLWGKPLCPVCGSPSRTGFMTGEGRRFYMKCPACGMEWRMQRVKCPWCGSSRVSFYTPFEAARWLRLYVCMDCGNYWRVVDEEEKAVLPPRWLYEMIVSPLDEVYEELVRRSGGR